MASGTIADDSPLVGVDVASEGLTASDVEEQRRRIDQEQSASGVWRKARGSFWAVTIVASALAFYAMYTHTHGSLKLQSAGHEITELDSDHVGTQDDGENHDKDAAATPAAEAYSLPEGVTVTDYLFYITTTPKPQTTTQKSYAEALAAFAKSPEKCFDTPDWGNKYDCVAEGYTEADGCTKHGWTCSTYEQRGWCQDNKMMLKKFPWAFFNSDFGLDKHEFLNKPSSNCCACGKPPGHLFETPPTLCTNTFGWVNDYNCRAEGYKEKDGCYPGGWSCLAYRIHGWCKDGVANKKEFRWAFYDSDKGKNKHEELNDPTLNCCECGKPAGVVSEAPGGNGPGKPNLDCHDGEECG
mmetsp:Transcript_116253/g.328887  ORF Transcript_116253/g.328887 Transcript_116253/m.328887 type:complete len:354 (+) Transcript_116253:60-1121(+)